MNKRYLLLLFSVSLFGNPSNPQVIQGKINLENPHSKMLHVHASDVSIIEWQNFSIEQDETTKFLQPNSESQVLNRVVGSQVSSLLGNLEANGKVYLINENGILFGESAVIDTNSFIASTLDILNEDFQKGVELFFKGDSKNAIINLGTLKAQNGDLILLAHRLENNGHLSAPNGRALLGAANEVIIRPKGEEYISIRTNPSHLKEEGVALLNTGTIEGANVVLKADGNHYTFAMNHQGEIDALGVFERDGQVILDSIDGVTMVEGSILAKNEDGSGGTIHLLGKNIALVGDCEIDASGHADGGTVLVGGDYQGKNPDIARAKTTFIDENAFIDVSSKESGSGGKVIVWSDEATGFLGTIHAKGVSGDGGFVEVSSPGHLNFQGIADRTSQHGKAGELLLDPTDFTIGGGVNSGYFLAGGVYTGSAASAFISTLAFTTNWNAGPVTVTTVSGFGGFGDITFVADILASNSNTLTLLAERDINVFAQVQNSGTGLITATAGRDLNVDGTTVNAALTTIGTTSVNVRRNLTLTGGVGDACIGSNAPLSVESLSTIATVGGNLTLSSVGTNDARLGSLAGISTDVTVGGNISLIGSPVSAVGTVEINTADELNVWAGGDILVNGSNVAAAIIRGGTVFNLTAGGSIILQGGTSGFLNRLVGGWNGIGTDMLIIAGKDFIMRDSSLVQRVPGPFPSTITIVVDNLYPATPQIGPGSFQMSASAQIQAIAPPQLVELRIFTARRSQNSIDPMANIRLTNFIPGPIYVNSPTEQWGVYYPSLFGGILFTIFYKDPYVVEAMEQAFVANTELNRYLQPYNQFITWYLKFNEKTENLPNYFEQDYHIPRHYWKDQRVLLPIKHLDL